MRKSFIALMLVWIAGVGYFADSALAEAPGEGDYSFKFLGPNSGVPTGLNDTGYAIGVTKVEGLERAWVYRGGVGAELLPLPAGATASKANGINNRGVVVGYASGDSYPRQALAWQPKGQTYEIVELGGLPGRGESEALAINDRGDIVGRAETGRGGESRAVLFSNSGGGGTAKDLSSHGFTALPIAVNDKRQVIGGSLRMDLESLFVENLGRPGEGFSGVTLTAISNRGQIAGSSTATTGLAGQTMVTSYADGAGWQQLEAEGVPGTAYSINNTGDMTVQAAGKCGAFGATDRGAAVFLKGRGLLCLNDLLKTPDADWIAVSDTAFFINSERQIVAAVREGRTSREGALLLSPPGVREPSPAIGVGPSATAPWMGSSGYASSPGMPISLSAWPHQPTSKEPWGGVFLDWTSSDMDSRGYVVARRATSQFDFVGIANTGFSTHYTDANVSPGQTYQYQVAALSSSSYSGYSGYSGYSNYSNIVTVRAPSQAPVPTPAPPPIDTGKPQVSIVSPAAGAQVSGVVEVMVNASDDKGLGALEVRVSGKSANTVLCSKTLSGEAMVKIPCSWDTSGLAPGSYQITALARDLASNEGTATISVVSAAAKAVIRVRDIELRGASTKDKVRVLGQVTVVDQNNALVPGATVHASWSLPDGKSESQTDMTGGSGSARFATADGPGAFTLRITEVSRSGAVFDAAGSKMSATTTVAGEAPPPTGAQGAQEIGQNPAEGTDSRKPPVKKEGREIPRLDDTQTPPIRERETTKPVTPPTRDFETPSAPPREPAPSPPPVRMKEPPAPAPSARDREPWPPPPPPREKQPPKTPSRDKDKEKDKDKDLQDGSRDPLKRQPWPPEPGQ